MFVKESLVKMLEPYVDFPDEFADRIMSESVYLGKKVYVVTQYSKRSKYEVVEAPVTILRYNPQKDTQSFTVAGKWGNENYYNATFRLNSIGKTVFLNPWQAYKQCLDKNEGQDNG